MDRFEFFIGKEIEKNDYEKIANFDNEIFSPNDTTFCYDTYIDSKTTLNLLEKACQTTVVCKDKTSGEVVSLLLVLPLNDNALSKYKSNKIGLCDLTSSDICDLENEKETNLAIYSLGVKKDLRGQKLTSINNIPTTLNKRLFFEFSKLVLKLQDNGIKIKEIASEGTSEAGIALSNKICKGNIAFKYDSGAILFATPFDAQTFADFISSFNKI